MDNTLLGRIVKFIHQQSRVLQAGNYIFSMLSGHSETRLESVRVPIDHYRSNLRKILATFNQIDVPVIFVTAPTSHYSLGVPDSLVERGTVPNKAFSLKMHREYNDVVREIAKEHGAYLIDMEAEFGSMGVPVLSELFLIDGIHFTAIGKAVLAQAIARELQQGVLKEN